MAPVPGLRVLLTWNAPADLDLYLTDPTAETVYFANNPSHSGAKLVHDTKCDDVAAGGTFMEVAYVALPQAGRYRVGVDFIDRCTAPATPISYRVVAELGGTRREATGVLTLEQFQPIALEVDVQPTSADGRLALSEEEHP